MNTTMLVKHAQSFADGALRDARFAVRGLQRNPVFALLAILALALGLGASGAVFSVAETVLLRPQPYHDPERLVVVLHGGNDPVAPGNYVDWQRGLRSFSALAAAEAWSANVVGTERTERVRGMRVTRNLFAMLGVQPLHGRFFDESTEARTVILSAPLWQSRFNADPAILGKTVRLDGESFTVAAVMPQSFRFAPFWQTEAQMWAPLEFGERASSRDGSSLRVFGRLAQHATISGAQAEVTALTARLEAQFPGTNRDVQVVPLAEKVSGDTRPALIMLLGAVVLVLLIACSNVAHMLLARAAARGREISIRTAIGASRAALIRQTLIESLVLCTLAGMAGLALAYGGVRLFITFGPQDLPRLGEVSMNMRVLAVFSAITMAIAVLFGLAPAIPKRRIELAESLRQGARGTSQGIEHVRVRQALLASEFALALMLLITAGLLMKSFIAVQRIEPGFNTSNLLTMMLSIRGSEHSTPERRAAFYRDVLESARAQPGITAAGFVNHAPLAGDVWGTQYLVAGAAPLPEGERLRAVYRVATDGYLESAGITLFAGRGITEQDRADGAPVIVINDLLADKHWPRENAIGRTLLMGEDENGNAIARTVVGVVRSPVQDSWTGAREPEVYLPLAQDAMFSTGTGFASTMMTLVVRTTGDANRAIEPLMRIVQSIDRSVGISDVRTIEDITAEATAAPRFNLILIGCFALVALVLGAVGVFGLISYLVARRTNELGIRMALGARATTVMAMIVRENMTLILGGTAAGLAGSFFATRLAQGLLFGVDRTDPQTFVLATLLLTTTALAATLIPAWRVTRIAPTDALRGE